MQHEQQPSKKFRRLRPVDEEDGESEDEHKSSSNDDNMVLHPNGTAAALFRDDALEDVLAMCRGEIIPSISNLQLFHYMLAYGHCSGSEGVCLDSLNRLEVVQNRIYERCVRHSAQQFSSAVGNNHQSKFTPNEWIDTFSTLAIDTDAGMPRIKKFADGLNSMLSANESSDNCSFAKDVSFVERISASSNKDDCSFAKDVSFVERMFHSACEQCSDRQLLNVPNGLKFPHCRLFGILSLPPSEPLTREYVEKGFLDWAVALCEWIAGIYESIANFSKDRDQLQSTFLMPSPKRMGITEEEFHDWCSVSMSLSGRRAQGIRRRTIPDLLKGGRTVEEMLITCWRQLSVVNIETINMILFYISYPIRDRGEVFVRSRLDVLLQRSYKLSTGENRQTITDKVSATMRVIVPSISPLISIRMIQFAQGIYHILGNGDEPTTTRLLRSTFVLDQYGTTGLQKVFRWVASGMVAATEAMGLIKSHQSDCLSIEVTHQSFKELLLRLVHFRCFGTGKRFVVDAVNMLLRTAGYDLTTELLHLATRSVTSVASEEGDRKKIQGAVDCIVEVMSSWHCIVTMTSAGSAEEEGNVKDFMEASNAIAAFENEIMQVNKKALVCSRIRIQSTSMHLTHSKIGRKHGPKTLQPTSSAAMAAGRS